MDRGNTPSVSRFKRGRGCVVSDDALTEASRILSEGGGVSLVMHRQRKHPPPFRVLSEGVCVVGGDVLTEETIFPSCV